MALIRHLGLRRVVVTTVWLGIAIGFAHLTISADRIGHLDPRAAFAAAGVAAFALALAMSRPQGARMRVVSGVAGALTFLIAAGLTVEQAAHETGVAIAVGGALIAAASLLELEPDADPRQVS